MSPTDTLTGTTGYAARLAHIGRLLDQGSVRSVVVVEISGNFVIRALDQRSAEQYLSEMVPDDFAGLSPNAGTSAQPDSYEARLHRVGLDLDDRVAANVSLIERKQAFQIVGWIHGEAAGRATYIRFEQEYPV